jgi:3,4-dihydroxy 2-butanone 4-phosphate synthase/GTP cyclohydrolase II
MSSVIEGLEALKRGGMIILVDDEERENEGDLVIAAEFATPEAIAFMAAHGRGLICLAMEAQRVEALGLPMMTANNCSPKQTAFTVSIEARTGVTTGISAHDRARTIAVASDPATGAHDLISPGHVFPLRAVEGGVLVRAGHTEGSVDLARIAGLRPAAVICEVMKDDGAMARRPDLEVMAQRYGLPIVTIKDLIDFRMASEVLVEPVAKTRLPSSFADTPLELHAFRSTIDGSEHLAVVHGPLTDTALVRIHSECLTGEALGSLRCDCGAQLQHAIRRISEAPSGVVVYMRDHEGRGIGLANKVRAYALQDQGVDTVEANHRLGFEDDLRNFDLAAHILKSLGVKRVRVMTNNPRKIASLEACGLEVAERVPIETGGNPHNIGYLNTKRDRLGHVLARHEEPQVSVRAQAPELMA